MRTNPFLACFLAASLTPVLTMAQATEPPCANTKPCGPSGSEECEPCEGEEGGEGANPFYPNSGNVVRHVTDLAVRAGAGQHRLTWRRTGFSRFNPGRTWFGDGHGWRHSYQYEMVYAGTSGGSHMVDILYPDGSIYRFTRISNVWTGVAGSPDKLTQNDAHFTLQKASGWRYHFERFPNGDGTNYYQLQDFTDAGGNVYSLTYDGSRRLALISEPAGRFLSIGYQQITANRADFQNLSTVTSTPVAGQWTEATVTSPTAFRYLRVYSGFNKFLSLAEIEFYDENNQLITGTPIGTAGLTNENFAKAMDGNVTTAFKSNNTTYGFTGLDLGAGNAKRVSKVRYYPRAGTPGDLVGAIFQGSNVAPALQTVIASVTASDGRAVNYSYTLFDDAMLDTDYTTLTGTAYGDGTAAAYAYAQSWAGVRPLMSEANDPRGEGRADRMKYEYWSTGGVQGLIKAERNAVTDVMIAELGGINSHSAKVTYANGAVRRFDFPSANASQIITRVDALERRTTYTYGAGGQGFMATRTDPLNRVISYMRTGFGNPVSITYPDNTSESWTRDDLDLPLTHTDELGRVTTWTRDGQHRITRIDYPDTSFETFTYNTFGQVLTHTLRNGGTETSVYDVRGLRTSYTDATNAVTTYTYDSQDLLATVTDARNHTTAYEYNERGLLTKIIYPDLTSKLYGYDTYGNLTSETNELSKVWARTYDEFSRLATATDPLNRTTQYFYEETPGSGGCCGGGSAGSGDHLTTVIFPSGRMTHIEYDLAWQKTAEIVGYGTVDEAVTEFVYDAAGNLTTSTDPRGKIWSRTYDARNRMLTMSDPLNNTTSWTYDAVGNKLTETRPNNGVTTMTYDAMNRKVTSTDPKNQATAFTYGGTSLASGTKGNNLVRLTDARNNSYDFTYDLADRKISMIYPGGSHEDWAYDAVGNVTTCTTRAGQVKTCTYDNRNRNTSCDWSDSTPDVSQTFDAVGRILSMSNNVSMLTYAYDAANQLLSETQDIDIPVNLPAKTVSYGYDVDGNRSSVTYPDGMVVNYTYTKRDQLEQIVVDGPPPLASYTYDLGGNRIGKTLENGTSVSYTYDDSSRLTSIDHKNGGVSFQRFDYSLNNVGNRTSRTETVAGSTKLDAYSHDEIDQLTQVQYDRNSATNTQARQVNYAYDATGNRTETAEDSDGSGPAGATTTPYTANNLNQYTSIDGLIPPAYDANGNLATIQLSSSDPTWNYVYDSENRLVSGNNATGTVFNFAYDSRNRRVAQTINGVSTAFLFDKSSLIDERSSSDDQIAKYVHGPVIDELLCRIVASGTGYYHQDGLGSTCSLTNASGSTIERVTYDIFGTPGFADGAGNGLPESSSGNRFLYSGREWLHPLSIYDYRNRAYLPKLGRFLQTDPIRFESGDENLYRYVLNSVTQFVDPHGLRGQVPPLPKPPEPPVPPGPSRPELPVWPRPKPWNQKGGCKDGDQWELIMSCDAANSAVAAQECAKNPAKPVLTDCVQVWICVCQRGWQSCRPNVPAHVHYQCNCPAPLPPNVG